MTKICKVKCLDITCATQFDYLFLCLCRKANLKITNLKKKFDAPTSLLLLDISLSLRYHRISAITKDIRKRYWLLPIKISIPINVIKHHNV